MILTPSSEMRIVMVEPCTLKLDNFNYVSLSAREKVNRNFSQVIMPAYASRVKITVNF